MEFLRPLSAKKDVLGTLAYADIFGYPLTFSEVWQFLVAKKKTAKQVVQKTLNLMVKQKKLATDGQFYFFPTRRQIVSKRLIKEKLSIQKLKIANRVANWLRLIPTIKMVAVTGALAMKNSTKNDDIDLLIVAAKKRLWLTRLFSVFLVELVSQRRQPGDRMVRNKICLNMFLDEAHLMVPKKEQDLFTAHEVCQLKPLWERENIYQKFINQNQWYQKYLPNWRP